MIFLNNETISEIIVVTHEGVTECVNRECVNLKYKQNENYKQKK